MRLAQGAGDRVELLATLLLGTALLYTGDYTEGVALIDRADAMTAHLGADASRDQSFLYLGAALARADGTGAPARCLWG